jgi:inhibitor of KinA sporulation pathway (predicted exonuclease)
MNYIVFDLEMTIWKAKIETDEDGNKFIWENGKQVPLNVTYQEVIEIGAVKLNDRLQVIDTFQTYVKPLNIEITERCRTMTKIQDKDIQNAPPFKHALEMFYLWIGKQPYTMVAWSQHDKKQIRNEANRKGYNHNVVDKMFKNHIDAQKLFRVVHNQITGIKNRDVTGLKKALDLLNINTENQHHKALDDSKDTVEIFKYIQWYKMSQVIREAKRCFI